MFRQYLSVAGFKVGLVLEDERLAELVGQVFRGFLQTIPGEVIAEVRVHLSDEEGIDLLLDQDGILRGSAPKLKVERRGNEIHFAHNREVRGWFDLEGNGDLWIPIFEDSPEEIGRIWPFFNTLHGICYISLARRSVISLHSSSFIHHERGFMCVGRSGAGKTTIARNMPPAQVLNEEISLIHRSISGEWALWDSPFLFTKRKHGNGYRSAPLGALFLLRQDCDNLAIPIESRQEALEELLKCTYDFQYGIGAEKIVLDRLSELVREIQVYRLHFRRDCDPRRVVDGLGL